jgi:hypothetical protein
MDMLEHGAEAREIRAFVETYRVPARCVTDMIFSPLAKVPSPGPEEFDRIEKMFCLFTASFEPLDRRAFSDATFDLVIKVASRRFLPLFAKISWATEEDAEPLHSAVRQFVQRSPQPTHAKWETTHMHVVEAYLPHLKDTSDKVT